MIEMKKIDWHKSRINHKAKELAWNDFDEDDQRVYMTEGEKIAEEKYKCIDCGEVHYDHYHQIMIFSLAKSVAWMDLDKKEQKSYLSKAEKEINKEGESTYPFVKKEKSVCSNCQGTGEVHTVCDQGHYGFTSKCPDCK